MLTLLIVVVMMVLLYLTIRREKAHLDRLQQVYREDALKYIYHQNEQGKPASLNGVKGFLSVSMSKVKKIVNELQDGQLVRVSDKGIRLTEQGRQLVMNIIRAHRIWETYLQHETDLPFHQIHQYADRKEHELTKEKLEALDAHLGFPKVDPHGDPIPAPDGSLKPVKGDSLTEWPVGKVAQIVHIEDEPESIAKKIFKLGFRLHDRIKILDSVGGKLRLEHKSGHHVIDGVTASQIQVRSVGPREEKPPTTLNDLQQGETAILKGLSNHIQGLARRRLLDLGFTPGAKVRKVMVSSFGGDPAAFEVRGAKIALRKEQAEKIFTVPIKEEKRGKVVKSIH